MRDEDPPERRGAEYERRINIELMAARRCYDTARLRLFDAHLRSVIKSVSPLTVDALTAEGLGIEEVVARLRAPTNWPSLSLLVHDTFRPTDYDSLALMQHRGMEAERRFERRHRSGAGYVLREAGRAGGGLGFRVCGDGLEIAMLCEDYLLTTAGGKGRLLIFGTLPSTIGVAMLGRPVADLIDHPLLTGRRYLVKRVSQNVATGSSFIVFDTGRQQVALGG
ncbi:hypothetical protein U1763_02585 [Sphingomonas sp. LB2R24]|uniref:hypothetical protein n=1 Tax=Sphingomonas sorbitolis TaxID=3096165 RepID=UPI002FCB670F